MNYRKEILSALCKEHSIDLTYTEAKEALQELDYKLNDDFYFELEGMEFRIIDDAEIWGIYVDTIKDITEECYLNGYSHTFSGYDGSELETAGYYIFRTN